MAPKELIYTLKVPDATMQLMTTGMAFLYGRATEKVHSGEMSVDEASAWYTKEVRAITDLHLDPLMPGKGKRRTRPTFDRMLEALLSAKRKGGDDASPIEDAPSA